MKPSDPDFHVANHYLSLERSDGVVHEGWAAVAQAFSGPELDALVDRQHLVVAQRVRPVEDAEVRIVRRTVVFSEAETVSIEAWFSKAISRRFVREMITSAHETGKLVIANPLADGVVRCDTSICGGSVVFLRFQGGTEPFYLLQHNFAVEALYFPLREALVYLNDCLSPKVKLRRLFVQLLRNGGESVKYFTATERRWAGLLVANDSPYHFFYFQVPGVAFSCLETNALPPEFHTLPSGHYLDVPSVLGLGDATRVHATAKALQSALIDEHSFIFSVGLRPANWQNSQRLKMVDGAVLAECRNECASDLASISRNYDLVLWAGISSGKRAWREEIEAVTLLVNRLAQGFARVLLLLDGWTGTLEDASGPEMYAGDTSAVERVHAAVASNVDCASLVGAAPVRKIGLGSAVDFFICSHGTASMYVARICGRPGVSHISNAARAAAIQHHIHPSTWLVPEELVTDLERTDARDKFRLDYSIDPAAFVTFAEHAFVASRPPGMSKPVAEII